MDLEELGMLALQESRDHFVQEREKARSAKIQAELSLKDLNSLIMSRNEQIAELERKGIKKFDLDEVKSAGQAPAGNKHEVKQIG